MGVGVARAAPVLWSTVLAVLLLGVALGPGYVLSYDMVWVPDLAVRPDFLGLGSSLPRAVPSDMVVSLVDEVVPGMLLQKVVLVLALVLAGSGAWRLVPAGGWVAGASAATLYVWNPFVAERLGIGHWPLLLTYAALPWIHRSARAWVVGEGSVARLALWIALGSLSPVGGVISTVFALLSVAVPAPGAPRRLVVTTGLAAALNAPWIVAGALHGSSALSDPLGVEVFAARGEGRMPALASLAGLGGIWNAEVVPVSRTAWPAVVSLVLVLGVCVLGAVVWHRSATPGSRSALVLAGVVGLVVAAAGAVTPDLVQWLVSHVPGAGLFRDGSRFIALLAPVQAVLFGLGAARLVAAVRLPALGTTLATALVLAPVALMPDAAWGLSGHLRAVDYPDELAVARAAVEHDREVGRNGDLLSLPFTSYRRPEWNHGRRTLDPVGRYFPVDYLASDTLVVSGQVVPGEDARATRVEHDLGTLSGRELTAALREEGIGWILVDLDAAVSVADESGIDPPELDGATVVLSGRLYSLLRLDDEAPSSTQAAGRVGVLGRVLLALAWAAAAGAVLAAGLRLLVARAARRQMTRPR